MKWNKISQGSNIDSYQADDTFGDERMWQRPSFSKKQHDIVTTFITTETFELIPKWAKPR